jgi:hypothetical protein
MSCTLLCLHLPTNTMPKCAMVIQFLGYLFHANRTGTKQDSWVSIVGDICYRLARQKTKLALKLTRNASIRDNPSGNTHFPCYTRRTRSWFSSGDKRSEKLSHCFEQRLIMGICISWSICREEGLQIVSVVGS